MRYTFTADEGHGWLRVPCAELLALGIAEQITRYSFLSESGQHAHLEEDCDLATFMAAKAARDGIADSRAWWTANVATRTVKTAHVRRMRRYDAALISPLSRTDAVLGTLPDAETGCRRTVQRDMFGLLVVL